jgi:integrase
VVDEYLAHKANEKKRSVDGDALILKRKILPAFGAETRLRKITREDIARFTKARLEQEVRPGHKVKAGTVANELSVFRHLLRLAQEWGYVAEVPKVKLPKRSEGRLRYLQPDEIARLLEACPESRNPHLGVIVVIALNIGMRRGEILGLEGSGWTWPPRGSRSTAPSPASRGASGSTRPCTMP